MRFRIVRKKNVCEATYVDTPGNASDALRQVWGEHVVWEQMADIDYTYTIVPVHTLVPVHE